MVTCVEAVRKLRRGASASVGFLAQVSSHVSLIQRFASRIWTTQTRILRWIAGKGADDKRKVKAAAREVRARYPEARAAIVEFQNNVLREMDASWLDVAQEVIKEQSKVLTATNEEAYNFSSLRTAPSYSRAAPDKKKQVMAKGSEEWMADLMKRVKAEKSFNVFVGGTKVIQFYWDDDMDIWNGTRVIDKHGKLPYYRKRGSLSDGSLMRKALSDVAKLGYKGKVELKPM